MRMRLILEEMHPGLPEFDARYSFHCYMNDENIGSSACVLSCSAPEVRIYGTDVVVPYIIRESNDSVEITASYMVDPTVFCTYELKFTHLDCFLNDDFDVDHLDPEIWGLGWPWGINTNTKNNSMILGDFIRVEDSLLVLPAVKMNTTVTDPETGSIQTASYVASCVNTLNRVHIQHGCVMINVDLHKQGGILFAAWLAQVNDGYFLIHPLDPERSRSGELGFLEYAPCWGEKYSITTHYYCDGKYSTADSVWCNVRGIMDGFNTFGVVRLDYGIFYYCNGELVSAYKGIARTSNSELCLLMATSFASKDNVHYAGNFTDDMLPLETKVDWVKMYKTKR